MWTSVQKECVLLPINGRVVILQPIMSNKDVCLSEISDCELHAFNMVPLLVKGFSPPLIEANAELTGISISRRVLFGSVAHLKLTVVFYASQSVCISLSLLSPNSYA